MFFRDKSQCSFRSDTQCEPHRACASFADVKNGGREYLTQAATEMAGLQVWASSEVWSGKDLPSYWWYTETRLLITKGLWFLLQYKFKYTSIKEGIVHQRHLILNPTYYVQSILTMLHNYTKKKKHSQRKVPYHNCGALKGTSSV